MDESTMSFEQVYAGPVDWNFPSPSATPTNTNFGNHVFQTPKTSTFSSHFHDAFPTPQMVGFQTPQPTQQASMTPMQRPQTSAPVLRSNAYVQQPLQNHHNTPSAMQPPMQPVQAIQPSPPNAQWHYNSGFSPAQAGHLMSFDTSQMRTPPPTRDSSTRKQNQQAQHVTFGTPSTIASRRFVSPQHQQHQVPTTMSHSVQQMPMQFPHLQFSPDMQQFSNFGPATAPVQSQTRLLWDQAFSPQVSQQQGMLDDPFSTISPQMPGFSQGMPTPNVPSVSFDTPAMTGFATQQPFPRPASAENFTYTGQQPQQPSMVQHPSTGVDPALVYSSPIRPASRSNGQPAAAKATSDAPQSQRKDSAAPARHARSETSSSTDTMISRASMGLRRSNTTGGASRSHHMQTPMRAEEALSRSNSINSIPRTSSPLKRAGKTPLGSISESRLSRSRPSVRLEIDENGRARTVTERTEDISTKALREKYPALWDSDSSDETSDISDQTPTRNASFSFTRGQERGSKMARLEAPVENLEGLTIPRSGSSASMKISPSKAAIAAAAQLRRQGSLRKTPSRTGSRRRSVAPASSVAMIDSAPLDAADEPDVVAGAQRSLRRSPSKSYRRTSWAPNSSFSNPQTSGDWSSFAPTQPAQSFQQQASMAPINEMSFYSTMPSAPAVQQPPMIRCQCGGGDSQLQPLVQCRSCTQWQHYACAGLDPRHDVSLYTCFLCTKPAPKATASRAGGTKRI